MIYPGNMTKFALELTDLPDDMRESVIGDQIIDLLDSINSKLAKLISLAVENNSSK